MRQSKVVIYLEFLNEHLKKYSSPILRRIAHFAIGSIVVKYEYRVFVPAERERAALAQLNWERNTFNFLRDFLLEKPLSLSNEREWVVSIAYAYAAHIVEHPPVDAAHHIIILCRPHM